MAKDDFSQYVITNKRKKYKFANFDSFANCFSHFRDSESSQTSESLTKYFGNNKLPLILEIAAGNAQFSLELARRHSTYNFIAIDIKSDRLYTSAKRAMEEGVKNIVFLRTHINEIDKIFEEGSVDTVWLTFPDPFPKKRSAKHRLSHFKFLQQYRNILIDTGSLKFKTDNRDLFLWSLEQLVACNWHVSELSFDLHESDLPDDYKIKTHYETKFLSQGIPTNYCSATSAPDLS